MTQALRQTPQPAYLVAPAGSDAAPLDARFGLADILSFVWRNLLLILVCVFLAGAAGAAYATFATPIFVARTKLLLERPRASGPIADAGIYQFTLDTAQIESQVQVIQSEQIARIVVRELDLAANQELITHKPSLLRRALVLLGYQPGTDDREPTSGQALTARILAAFDDRLSARRLGQSYVIETTFWAHDGALAARIANAITAAYLHNQLMSKAEAAESGNELLEKRIVTLRMQLAQAAAAVRTGQIDVETFPTAEARVLTGASIPLGRSWPRTDLTVVLAALLGLVLGVTIAALRRAR